MACMDLTLDVSRLSGWLNADCCRDTTGLTEGDTGGEVLEGVEGGASARSVH